MEEIFLRRGFWERVSSHDQTPPTEKLFPRETKKQRSKTQKKEKNWRPAGFLLPNSCFGRGEGWTRTLGRSFLCSWSCHPEDILAILMSWQTFSGETFFPTGTGSKRTSLNSNSYINGSVLVWINFFQVNFQSLFFILNRIKCKCATHLR